MIPSLSNELSPLELLSLLMDRRLLGLEEKEGEGVDLLSLSGERDVVRCLTENAEDTEETEGLLSFSVQVLTLSSSLGTSGL